MAKNIVLLNPPVSLAERYGTLGGSGTQTPPLGLAVLAAVLRERGFSVSIIDAPVQGMDIDSIVGYLRQVRPPVIGITATCISIRRAGELARRLKSVLPETLIVIGGPQLAAMPEETMADNPHFDIGVVGEGEATVVELMKALEEGGDLGQIPGLLIRQGAGMLRTPSRNFIQDLNSLPFPAWDLLPQPLGKVYQPAVFSARQFPAFSLVTSRGCPSQCIFCDRAVFGNTCRAHSARYVFEMMQALHGRYGIREFAIADDTFNLFKKRLLQLCQMLIDSKMKVSWSCNARIDCVDEEGLRLMKKSGCWQIAYGLESGSQKILDLIQKRQKIEKVREAVALTKRYGIRVKGFFMFGCPGETEETMRQTIDFVRDIGIDDFQLTYFTPLPGSLVFKEAERYGSFNRDLAKMNYWQALFIPHGLTKDALNYYYRRAYREFYFRLATVLSYLGLTRSWRHLFRLLQGAFLLTKMTLGFKDGKQSLSQKKFWEHDMSKRRPPSHRVIESVYRPRAENLKGMLTLPPQVKFLDVGCGNGFLSYYLQEDFFTVGLDSSSAMLKVNPCTYLVQADAMVMPFKDASFDVVACSAFLHHLSRKQALETIGEMKRICRRYVVFYEPNRNNPAMFLFGLLNREEWGTLRFSKRYLEKIASEAGLVCAASFTSELIAPNKTPLLLLPLMQWLNRNRFLNRVLGLTNCLITVKA